MDEVNARSTPSPERETHSWLRLPASSWLLLASPLLFALASLMSFYATNAGELEIVDLLPTLAIRLLAVLAGIAALYALTRRVALTAFLVALLSVAYFYYGHAYTLLADIRIDLGLVRLGPNRILALLALFAAVSLAVAIVRKPDLTLSLAKTMAVLGVSLTLTATGMAMWAQFAPASATEAKAPVVVDTEPWAVPPRQGSEQLPDIYYIVLDAYASDESLAEFAGYDNSSFTDHLKSKGFYVAEQSRSNYSTSFLSLAATLNMEYINDVIAAVGGEKRTVLYKMARKNRVVKTLKDNGYTYTHILSGWGATNKAPMADVVLKTGTSEVEAGLKDSTMFRPFANRSLTKKKYLAVRKSFEHLETIDRGEGPQFVFAHILVPHGPYVFKSNGEMGLGSSTDMSNWREPQKDDYIAQLQATNRMTTELVDRLIATHDRPLVIIIQGDHGTNFRTVLFGAVTLGANRELYLRRHSILNAMYFSEGNPEELYPSISSVNTFRVVLNEVLGTDYEMLPDRAYNSASYSDSDDLSDVTDEVMANGE